MEPSNARQVVLIAYDNKVGQLRNRIKQGLSARGLAVTAGSSAKCPDGSGIVVLVGSAVTSELLSVLRSLSDHHTMIAVLSKNCVDCDSVLKELIRHGAQDILLADDCEVAAELYGRITRWQEIDDVVAGKKVFQRAVGRSHRWVDVVRRLTEVAYFTTDTILLQGASGTGKDLLARLVHDLDQRPDKRRFVILDCTTVVPELAGSEFFGHERGAFTGAVADREGVFAEADYGTLFLDEVGDLPLSLQPQLLRVIQEGTYRRVGANRWYRTYFRLICATNKNLAEEVEAGRFRRDLYYRIAKWTFSLPSLAERTEDIPLLINHFLKHRGSEGRTPVRDELVEHYLCNRPYPGNVRELRLLVERLCVLGDRADIISAGCIPSDEWSRIETAEYAASANGSDSFIRDALDRSLGLEQIAAQARMEAIKLVMAEELDQVGSDPSKRAEIIARTAERLKCSRRWIQKYNKDHTLFQTLSTRDEPQTGNESKEASQIVPGTGLDSADSGSSRRG